MNQPTIPARHGSASFPLMAAAAKLASGSAFRSDILAERPRQPRPVKAPPNCGLADIVGWLCQLGDGG
jgi:hypothetical protein